MKKVVCVAIRHPTEPNLFLHGLRRDNHKWAIAGGHAKPGELDKEAASRELEEETGLRGVKIDKVHENIYGDNHIVLFAGSHPEGAELSSQDDPDKEFVTFKFLDPTSHSNMHVPGKRNILSSWLKGGMTKTELPLDKAQGKITVEPFVVDKAAFNPRKHDFIVRVQRAGKQIGFLAVTHKPEGIMPFNFEVNALQRRKGYGTAMALHAQKISGKKIVRSPDMTEAGSGFADKFVGPKPLKKAEVIHNEDSASLMNRIETKHMMPKSNMDKLLNGIKAELPDGDPDTSVRFNVNKTIYLDNMDLDALRDNMESHKPRFKVRIRQYSPNGEQWEDVAYVELKLKTKDGETKKVRVRINASDIPSVCEGKIIRIDTDLEDLNRDIPKDILWKRVTSINVILEKYGFRKQIMVTYQRRAYSNDKIRVTVDDSIRFSDASELSPDALSMVKDSSYWKAFKKRHLKIRKDDYVIVEVKEETGIPKWLRKILEECDAQEVRFSKYCGAMVSFLQSGEKSDGPITRERKIDANSVLAQIDGYQAFNKAQEAPVVQNLTLAYPVSINGKMSSMMIKNFGDASQVDPNQVKAIVDQHKFNEPASERDMMFTPHKLKSIDGKEHHVLAIRGVPPAVTRLNEATKGMGTGGSQYHIPIEPDEFDKLSAVGTALTAKDAGVKFHPAELRLGGTVLKTY